MPNSKFSDFGRKPWTITQGFFFDGPKKVSRKACLLNVHEETNLMALVSVA